MKKSGLILTLLLVLFAILSLLHIEFYGRRTILIILVILTIIDLIIASIRNKKIEWILALVLPISSDVFLTQKSSPQQKNPYWKSSKGFFKC